MRPILFNTLLFKAAVYSFSAFTQTLSQAEHCIALEEKIKYTSTISMA